MHGRSRVGPGVLGDERGTASGAGDGDRVRRGVLAELELAGGDPDAKEDEPKEERGREFHRGAGQPLAAAFFPLAGGGVYSGLAGL